MVSFQDFKRLDIRIAQIKSAEAHPNADKLLILKIDIGTEERSIVAGIRKFYKPDELIGKKIVVVTNLEPATIRGVESAGMLLAASDDETLTLLVPENNIKLGSKIS